MDDGKKRKAESQFVITDSELTRPLDIPFQIVLSDVMSFIYPDTARSVCRSAMQAYGAGVWNMRRRNFTTESPKAQTLDWMRGSLVIGNNVEALQQLYRFSNISSLSLRDFHLPTSSWFGTVDLSGCKAITYLNISECGMYFTNESFKCLKSITTLKMSGCNQASITDSAIESLTTLTCLDLSFCDQNGLSDICLKKLTNLTLLNMTCCTQPGFTDAAFVSLKNLKSLDLTLCRQFSNKAICHLTSLSSLSIGPQNVFTNEALLQLVNLTYLDINFPTSFISGEGFKNLGRLVTLKMNWCGSYSGKMTDEAFIYTPLLQHLEAQSCKRLTDAALKRLPNLTFLDIKNCNQERISNAGLGSLVNLTSLNMRGCDQESITDQAFKNLTNLTSLNLSRCSQPGITKKVFDTLTHLVDLDVSDCSSEVKSRAMELNPKHLHIHSFL